MALTVKNKIWLGTLFLFILLILTGATAIYYTAKIKSDTKNVLRDNYESLSYCHAMQQQLLRTFNGKAGIDLSEFDKILKNEENNITEEGEKKAATTLRNYFSKLQSGDTTQQTISAVEAQIQTILILNMQAIQRKSKLAEDTAESALTIIITFGGIVFLIAFTFIVNFPSVITNPISSLTDAIKEISNKNYSYRVHIDNKDEFGKLADSFNEMAARLQYFESSNLNKLMFEKSRAESVINSLKDASIGLDKNNLILFANEEALQLLNMRNEDIVGKKTDEIVKRNDLFKFLMDNNSSTPFKIVVQNHENYFIKETVDIGQNETQSKVIVVKNITSFKELDVAKTNFIATISHELKTPLAASDFSLKLLEDERTGNLSNDQKELIKNLKDDNQRMLKILSELLNMSQVEAGRIQLNSRQVDPKIIVENALQAVETNAKEKNIGIKNYAEENLPLINADEDKTVWVLNNFLTNAIKYSLESSIIETNIYKKNDDIIFSVKDHGKGIANEYQSKIFDRYFKVPNTNEKGSGLGLAISKDFIEAQGGNIWVESELGKGSTFSFGLPAKV
jgi:NtrC-family two-component system sensor histidine kinase KinB